MNRFCLTCCSRHIPQTRHHQMARPYDTSTPSKSNTTQTNNPTIPHRLPCLQTINPSPQIRTPAPRLQNRRDQHPNTNHHPKRIPAWCTPRKHPIRPATRREDGPTPLHASPAGIPQCDPRGRGPGSRQLSTGWGCGVWEREALRGQVRAQTAWQRWLSTETEGEMILCSLPCLLIPREM